MKIFKHIATLNFKVNAHVSTTSILSLTFYYTCYVFIHSSLYPSVNPSNFLTQLKVSFKYHFISQNYIILFDYLQKAWKIGIINSIVQMETWGWKIFRKFPKATQSVTFKAGIWAPVCLAPWPYFPDSILRISQSTHRITLSIHNSGNGRGEKGTSN